jgi:hypothetical protein
MRTWDVAHPMCVRCFSSPLNNHSFSTSQLLHSLHLRPHKPRTHRPLPIAEDRHQGLRTLKGIGTYVIMLECNKLIGC